MSQKAEKKTNCIEQNRRKVAKEPTHVRFSSKNLIPSQIETIRLFPYEKGSEILDNYAPFSPDFPPLLSERLTSIEYQLCNMQINVLTRHSSISPLNQGISIFGFVVLLAVALLLPYAYWREGFGSVLNPWFLLALGLEVGLVVGTSLAVFIYRYRWRESKVSGHSLRVVDWPNPMLGGAFPLVRIPPCVHCPSKAFARPLFVQMLKELDDLLSIEFNRNQRHTDTRGIVWRLRVARQSAAAAPTGEEQSPLLRSNSDLESGVSEELEMAKKRIDTELMRKHTHSRSLFWIEICLLPVHV